MTKLALPVMYAAVLAAVIVMPGPGRPSVRRAPAPEPSSSGLPRVLFLTHSAGFRHSVVTRGDAALSYAEHRLTEAARGRFEVVATQDGSMLTRENLARFAAVVFYTTGELPADARPLLDFVRAGGGFAGIHSATDTWYTVPEYGELVGGRFDGHPWHQKVRVRVEDRSHPSTDRFRESFEIADEIYQFRDWDRAKVNVVLSLDTSSVDARKGKRADGDYALAWSSTFGRGRVFYTALGHREDVWTDARFLSHVVGGIVWTLPAERLQDSEEGFTPLFNGKDMSGWKFCKDDASKAFEAKDGAIVCGGRPNGYMYTEKSYKDFTLRFDWRYKRPEGLEDESKFGGNSGYLLWIQDHKVWPRSLEVQGMNKNAGAIIPIGVKAKFESDEATRTKARKPVGEWNAMEIVGKGGTVTVTLNGTEVTTVSECDVKEGPIGFQSEGAEIHWRNIRIKE